MFEFITVEQNSMQLLPLFLSLLFLWARKELLWSVILRKNLSLIFMDELL